MHLCSAGTTFNDVRIPFPHVRVTGLAAQSTLENLRRDHPTANGSQEPSASDEPSDCMSPSTEEATHPCMGQILSRGCYKGPIHFLIPQFLCLTGQAFLRPDLHIRVAGARRGSQGWPPRRAANERPGLDGSEHDGTLGCGRG